jgi:YVTN family beta-propeller protein
MDYRHSIHAKMAMVLFALLVLATASYPLAHGQSVVATLQDGGPSSAVAYDSAKGEVFVADSGSTQATGHTVSVISDSTNSVVATVAVGSDPVAIAYDSGKGEVFVANNYNDTVTVVSDANNSVVATVPVGGSPNGLGYDSGKGEVFVTYGSGMPSSPNAIAVISDATNTVIATINVNQTATIDEEILQTQLVGVAYDPAKGELFVANEGLNTVLVIADANNSVVATVPVGSYPYGLAYDSARGEVFVANSNEENFTSVISATTNTVVANVTVGQDPYGVAYDPANGEVFVVNAEGSSYGVGNYNGTSPGTVSVISDSTNSVVDTIPVGVHSEAIAYDSGNGEAFVPSGVAGTLDVISSSTPVSSSTTSSAKSSSSSLTFSYVGLAALNAAIIGLMGAFAFSKQRSKRWTQS